MPLGTMGPLKRIRDLPDNFLVMNGDVLTDLDFKAFYQEHINDESLFSISAHVREQIIDYGVLETDALGRLIDFHEKPRNMYQVSMGIYMVSREILQFIEEGVPYGFDNLMLDGLANKRNIDIRPFSGYWLDIGRPDDYQYADENFIELSARLGIV